MMKALTINTVPDYCDGVQLFIGTDVFKTQYICLLVLDKEKNEERYLGVRISDKKISDLRYNRCTLRSIFTEPGQEYFFVDWTDEQNVEIERANPGFLPAPDMLPDEEYVCTYYIINALTARGE